MTDRGILIDPSLKARSNRKQWNRLVKDLFDDIKDKPTRKDYRSDMRNTLRAILFNLYDLPIHRVLGFHRHHRAPENRRYKWFRRTYLIKNADYLESRGLIEQRRGRFLPPEKKGESLPSRMWPTSKLLGMFEKYGVGGSQLIVMPPRDLIRLRDSSGEYSDFEKTDWIREAEALLRQLNNLYKESSIQIDGREVARRFSYRTWRNNFEMGGRFYGDRIKVTGKPDRRKIKLNGEPTTEYDFSGIHPAMMYASIGESVTDDIYHVNGYPDSKPDRKIMKAGLLRFMNCGGDVALTVKSLQRAFTKKIRRRDGSRYVRLTCPAWLTDLDQFVADIAEHHKPITEHLCTGKGLDLQYLDSLLANRVMHHFLEDGIVTLGVHDSFVVQKQYGDRLRDVMEAAFEFCFGVRVKITHEF
jgi:hypothetical protein